MPPAAAHLEEAALAIAQALHAGLGGGAGGFHPWALNEEASQPFFKRAIEAGINFFDTAELYPTTPLSAETYADTERLMGDWFEKTGKRDQVVVGNGSNKADLEIHLRNHNRVVGKAVGNHAVDCRCCTRRYCERWIT